MDGENGGSHVALGKIVFTVYIVTLLENKRNSYFHSYFCSQVKYVKDVFPDQDGNILVMCISITSGISRIVFGKIADFKWFSRIRLQQCGFAILGIATLCIPFSDSFGGLIAITLIMGVCDGVFICLLGPIAFDIVGESGASQALGFLFGIFSVPMTVGPPVAGKFCYHKTLFKKKMLCLLYRWSYLGS